MASLNKVFLIGNLTRDPDLRNTPSGAAVCEFGLAVNRRFVANGVDRDETCFVDITVWNKAAENCKRFLEKGSPVMVEGRLQLDQWDDREGGGKRSKLRVVAEQVQFLGNRREGGDNGVRPNSYGAPQQGNYGNSGYGAGNGNYRNQQPHQGGFGQPYDSGNYQSRPYNPPRQQPGPGQMPPMPDGAFNPGTEAEEDIPF